MPFGLQWIVDKITFPSPDSSYSLTSHPELFFVKSPKSRPSFPGVPCMLYAVPQGAPVLLVHAHSNGCDIGDMRQTLQSISESLRVHVMSFEFPGYGLHVGSANMRTIDEAANAVLHFIIDELRINIAQVVWYGRSIGSGPAVRVVHKITKELQKQPGGVVLQCGYANFPEVAGHLFGRVAKQLVSPLWPNEALVRDLKCPVLLIHGRNDTMIPIEQSEKLWKAVCLKDASHFYTCDCGHNDFNFRRCTLRPIYDFLLGVISSPGFPTANFTIEVAASSRAFVHHIGPLRTRIPVYSFRRTELEEWMRRLQQRGTTELQLPAEGGSVRPALLGQGQRVVLQDVQEPQLKGRQGVLLEYDQQECNWRVRLDCGEEVRARPGQLDAQPGCARLRPGLQVSVTPGTIQGRLMDFCRETAKWRLQPDGALAPVLVAAECLQLADAAPAAEAAESLGAQPSEAERLEAKGREVHVSVSASASGGAQKQQESPAATKPPKCAAKDKPSSQPPPIPDFTELPPIEDVSLALLDPEGMVRTCALRVDAFLERLQRQLDRIDSLESKPLEEVIEFVEAEFWACDPLLCLWEEVSLPQGERVRFRLGPFSIDSTGASGYDRGLGAGSSPGPHLLRIPTWIFQPSPAHFRCLAEWSLLHSERLQRNLPATGQAKSGSGCCCVPSKGLRRKRKPRGGRRGVDSAAHPTRGVLATSLAAHFVNWVDKTNEIKQVFARFVALHNNPEESLRRRSAASALTGPSLGPKDLPSDSMARSPQQSVEEHDFEEEEISPPHTTTLPLDSQASLPLSQPRGDGGGDEAVGFVPRPPWAPAFFSASSRAVLREGIGSFGSNLSELYARMGVQEAGRAADRGDQSTGPNILDFEATAELITNTSTVAPDRNSDWLTAGFLLHYDRIISGWSPSASGKVETTTEDAWGDPMRPEVQKTAAALNKAAKAFAHAEHRERREHQRQRLKPARIPVPAPDADGDPEPPPGPGPEFPPGEAAGRGDE